jgi:hypothetical protein
VSADSAPEPPRREGRGRWDIPFYVERPLRRIVGGSLAFVVVGAGVLLAWGKLRLGLSPTEIFDAWQFIGLLLCLGLSLAACLMFVTFVMPRQTFRRIFWVVPLLVGAAIGYEWWSHPPLFSDVINTLYAALSDSMKKAGCADTAAWAARYQYVEPVLVGCTLSLSLAMCKLLIRLPDETSWRKRALLYLAGVAAVATVRMLVPSLVLLQWPDGHCAWLALASGWWWALPCLAIAIDLGQLIAAKSVARPSRSESP